MADVFISYKRTPARQLLARRLSLILRAHEISVWWDSGLESGEEFEATIEREISAAAVVTPLWCARSINADWVLKEARLGRTKLLPARLQNVSPPREFDSIHACDLAGWDGTVRHNGITAYLESVRSRIDRRAQATRDMLAELDQLPACGALPPHEPEAQAILNRLRRAYLDQDPAIDFEDATAISMDSPIADLIDGRTATERLDDLWRLVGEGYNSDLLIDEDDTQTVDDEDLEGIDTVGDLVWLLVDRQTSK